MNLDLQAAREKRLHQLNELEEFRLHAYENAKLYKENTKKWHDQKIVCRQLELGQQVLLYDSRLKFFPRKLKSKWSGQFVITQVLPYRVIEIYNPKSSNTFKVNRQHVKH